MPIVAHTGFWTYLLVAVVVVVLIALISPALFASILEAIRKLSQAGQGKNILFPIF
jgi:Na+-transporting NADH:ubiquinone oxidoreductase subunit NqrB